MTEFPGNSQRRPHREERPQLEAPKVDRVVEGEVVRRKRPLGKRLREVLIGGDSTSVWEYVMLDVLVPAAKDAVADAVSQGVERMIFGEVRTTTRRNHARGGPDPRRYNYNAVSRAPIGPPREDPRSRMTQRGRATHDFDEIILDSRAEAEEVLDRMFDMLEKYESVKVSNLYELVGISSNFTDERYGWIDLRGAGVSRVRGGYLLNLPRPELLER